MKRTVSSIRTFLDCPRKFQWSYVEQIRPIKQSDALRFGSLFHDVLERLDLGITWADICQHVNTRAATDVEMQQVLRLAAGHQHAYVDDGFAVLETEGVFTTEIGGIDFTGKRDRIVELPDGRRALQEYKTSSEDISPGSIYWQRLRLDLQVTAYQLSADVDTIIYDVTRKPSIRLRKDETVEEYGERLSEDIRSRPEWYFQRLEVARTEADLDATIEDIQSVHALMSLGQYPRNTSACKRYGTCPYFSECSVNRLPSDGVPVGFERIETAHPELNDGADGNV